MKNAWHILTPQKCFAASSLLEATLNLYLNYLRHKLPTGDENLLWCWKCAGSCSKLLWSCLTFHVGYSDFQSRSFLQGFKKERNIQIQCSDAIGMRCLVFQTSELHQSELYLKMRLFWWVVNTQSCQEGKYNLGKGMGVSLFPAHFTSSG